MIQLQKETAYLPPSCSLLRESGAAKSTRTAFTSAGKHEPVIFSFPTHDLAGTHQFTYHGDAQCHNERKQETLVKVLLEN